MMQPRHAPALLLLSLVLLAALPAVAHAQSGSSSVTLNWTAPGDDSLAGRASQYDLRYSTATITAANFGSATRLTGMAAPAVAGSAETATVSGLAAAITYHFAIRAADESGNWSVLSNMVTKTTGAVPDTVRSTK